MARKKVYDIGLTNDELRITDGDFEIEESTERHQNALILDEKGDTKQFPTANVGANSFIEDNAIEEFLQEISLQFADDGMKVTSVEQLPNKNINTIANY